MGLLAFSNYTKYLLFVKKIFSAKFQAFSKILACHLKIIQYFTPLSSLQNFLPHFRQKPINAHKVKKSQIALIFQADSRFCLSFRK